MADFQVELGFTLADEESGLDNPGDVDLLESLGQHIEVLAGEMGPTTALVGDQYIAALTVEAETPLDAGKRASDVFIQAMTSALAERGDEFAARPFARYFGHLHVDRRDLSAV